MTRLPLRGRLWPRERRTYLDNRRYPGEAGWRRPTEATASAVWKRVNEPLKLTLSGLLPSERWFANLDADELDAAATTVQRALAVALDTAVLAGQSGRMLTQNLLFDALASRWSERYRTTIENSPATCSYEMLLETLRIAWRELLRGDIRFVALWKIVRRGCAALYTTTRIPKKGFTVTLPMASPLLDEFLRIMANDPVYERHDSRPRLLGAEEMFPKRHARSEVTAEWQYNVVSTGPRSLELIDRLEAARLLLDVNAVQKYADDWEAEAKNSTGERRDAALAESSQYGRVRAEIRAIKTAGGITDDSPGEVWYAVKTRMSKAINRRYHPRNFWPIQVSGEAAEAEKVYEDEWRQVWATASLRGQWFWAPSRQPLVGVDVSTSQYQILAAFLGLETLEKALRRQSLKELFTARALERDARSEDRFQLPRGFDGADSRLTSAIKHALLTFGYGSEPHNIARALRKDYPPGLGDAENVKALLAEDELLTEIFNSWKPACGALAARADKYKGLVLTDPFDGAKVRWNPVRVNDTVCAGDRDNVKIRANLPVMARRATRGGVEWTPARPNRAGDYPIDRAALRRMIGPCLVHMLDSLFAGIVVEKLNELGVRDVVSIHDAWLIPADSETALHKAVASAGEPWLRSLKPVYRDLVRYLGPTKFGPWIKEKQKIWKRRVQNRDWPVFRVERQIIFEPTVKSKPDIYEEPERGR